MSEYKHWGDEPYAKSFMEQVAATENTFDLKQLLATHTGQTQWQNCQLLPYMHIDQTKNTHT